MKFTNGQWLFKEEFSPYSPKTLFDVHFDGENLFLYLSVKRIENRADMIDQGSITYRFYAPREGIIGVQCCHFTGVRDSGVHFPLNLQPGTPVKCSVEEKEIRYSTGELEARIDRENFQISYYYKDRFLTRESAGGTHYLLHHSGTPYMKQQLSLEVGETVYGLGERFTPFVRNGQSVDIWNEDGGTSSELSYKNIPFYLSSRNYGVFVNDPGRVSFEIASENMQKVQFSIEGESQEYFLFGGENLKEVISDYTALTGRPALPPRWSFGLWLSTSFTTSYDENTVMGFIDGMAERDIPLEVFHFDCFWMKEFQWTDFVWDDRTFANPRDLLKKIHSRGLKVCLWINPYIAQKSSLFEEGKKKGYLLKKPNGDVWQTDKWQAGMGIVDFSNPEACSWYSGYLADLIDMGVDTFKTDFGERIPTDVVYSSGADPVKMHNYYTLMYNETVFNLLKEKLGPEEAMVFARSATVGGQCFPVHWGGDCWATYPSMAESLRGGLSLGLAGFGYWSHDMGGFEQTAEPDLYKRWCAFGMLSSHSRLHGSTSVRVPWSFDEESVDVLRHFTRLKYSLMPYLYHYALQASHTGIPMMRAMILEFPDDRGCRYLDQQYMLGEQLLVAPILSDSGEGEFYLPRGRWTHLLSGKILEGPGFHRESYDYFSLPLFVAPNSLIARREQPDSLDDDSSKPVILEIFELEDGQTAFSVVEDSVGKPELTVEIRRKGSLCRVKQSSKNRPWSLLLRNQDSAEGFLGSSESVSGGLLLKDCESRGHTFEFSIQA